jgi:ubiquitin carboxyl-terminal hydrolase 36/42
MANTSSAVNYLSLSMDRTILNPDLLKPYFLWQKMYKVGPGLKNIDHTCYVNAIVQILCYSPLFGQACLHKLHSKTCKDSSSSCLFCVLELQIRNMLSSKNHDLTDVSDISSIVHRIRNISKSFKGGGSQEDVHQFLLELMSKLQSISLKNEGLNDRFAGAYGETTLIKQIFSGDLKSTLSCPTCSFTTSAIESFTDISLSIGKSNSVSKSLKQYLSEEVLDAKNKWFCSSCSSHVQAKKKYSFQRAPNTLMLSIKRFTKSNEKISTHLEFGTCLSVEKDMLEGEEGVPLEYDLFGVVQHEGFSTRGGHFISYVKSSHGIWYCINDEAVSQVSLKSVLSVQAYLLFYTLTIPTSSTKTSNAAGVSGIDKTSSFNSFGFNTAKKVASNAFVDSDDDSDVARHASSTKSRTAEVIDEDSDDYTLEV